jgi:protein-S-isoprenylcysteine O-methyltransferase Ste14
VKDTKILPPTSLLAALLAQLALGRLVPLSTIITGPWRWLGALPLAAGVALNLWADAGLKRAGTTVKPFQPSNALVENGAYGLSRHPMYLGYVLILAGVATLLRSLSPWLVIPPFAL